MVPLHFILDTSAVLRLLRDERGAGRVAGMIGECCGFHRLHLGELYGVVRKRDGAALAKRIYSLVAAYPFRLLDELGDTVLLSAGDLKAEFKLGFMDAFVAAIALLHNATLVTGDNDFRILEQSGIVKVEWL